MEDIATFWNFFLGVCASIAAIGAATLVLGRWGNHLKRPKDEIEQEIKELREEVEEVKRTIGEHEGKLLNDHNRINELVEGQRPLMECVLQITSHLIDGNHTDQMTAARDNLQSYLVNR